MPSGTLLEGGGAAKVRPAETFDVNAPAAMLCGVDAIDFTIVPAVFCIGASGGVLAVPGDVTLFVGVGGARGGGFGGVAGHVERRKWALRVIWVEMTLASVFLDLVFVEVAAPVMEGIVFEKAHAAVPVGFLEINSALVEAVGPGFILSGASCPGRVRFRNNRLGAVDGVWHGTIRRVWRSVAIFGVFQDLAFAEPAAPVESTVVDGAPGAVARGFGAVNVA